MPSGWRTRPLPSSAGSAGGTAQLEGMLRLSSSDWFGVHMLAPVLAEFSHLQPRVVVELLTDARLYSLPRREADMVFRIAVLRRAGGRHPPPDAYRLWRLSQEGQRAAAPRRRQRNAVDHHGQRPSAGCATPSGSPVCSRTPMSSPAATTATCRPGCAASAPASPYCRAPWATRLRASSRIDLGEDPPGRDTWVGYHRDLKRLARLRALLDLVIQRLGN